MRVTPSVPVVPGSAIACNADCEAHRQSSVRCCHSRVGIGTRRQAPSAHAADAGCAAADRRNCTQVPAQTWARPGFASVVKLRSCSNCNSGIGVVGFGASGTWPKWDRPKRDRPKWDRPKRDRPKRDRPERDRPKRDRPRRDRRSGITTRSGCTQHRTAAAVRPPSVRCR